MASTAKPPYTSDDAVRVSSYVADADLSSYQNHMVKKTSTGVALCGSGEDHYGLLDNAPTSGAYAEVVVAAQQTTAVAAAAVSASGLPLKVAASGKVTPASSGDKCCGTALTTAAGDGSLLIVKLDSFTMN